MPYQKLSQANPAIRGIDPPVTLEQANWIANVAEGIPEGDVDNPWAVAIAQFKRSHKKNAGGSGWIKKSLFDIKKSIAEARAIMMYTLISLIRGARRG